MAVFLMFAGDSIPQPPPRRPVAYAEQHENDEEKQFRRVFQQLAGDVSDPLYFSFNFWWVFFCSNQSIYSISLIQEALRHKFVLTV